MNQISEIKKFEGREVRIVAKDGQPWWVLADVCKILEIDNYRNVAARLDEDEKGVHLVDTLGGPQEMTIINEFGLYSVILRSEKPEAKRFKRWVTHEVLPALSRRGRYVSPGHKKFKAQTKALKNYLDLWDITEDAPEREGIKAEIERLYAEITEGGKE